MAFNINAHVILSGPKNIKAVTKRIQTQLGSVNARINLVTPKGLSKQIGSFNKGLSRLNKSITTLQSSATSANTHLQKLGTQFRSLNKASSSMSKSQAGVQKSLAKTGHQVKEVANEIQAFGKDAALAIRRFAAFTVATGVVFGFVRAIQGATKAAIDYEREIVKIVQVTGASADKIDKLNNTIRQLSVSLGVDANELAELGRIFAQTGQTIDEVGASIRAIARSSLAPSFGTMKSTAEGLIAAMAQFNIAASESEAVLASLNAVSKKWAVEAEDMISVIRRAGGVFAASAGQMDDPKKSLNELIGIFVAVRSTSRESADTIAVGLRTIFTRIQRRGTIEFLKQFNIELIDAKGNFIGLFPAFQALAKGLDGIIKRGDALTLSAITEELGGVRQVGKLIPAITQFNKALAATKVAGKAAADGLGKDVALALQPLGKQFEVLQQRFNALIRDITQTKTFQNMAKIALSMANAFLSVAEVLKPLIPLMTTFAAIKLSKGLFEFGKGFMGGLSKGGGAGGAGGALGGAVTGGGGGGASGGAARSVSVQQALTTAIKSHATLLASNNTALTQLGTQVTGNTTAITTTGGKVAISSTQIIGSMGNLINALNRASLGGFGGGSGGRRRGKKFARGGYVSGPSHSQGGVPAELEGGEYVIPKGFADGGNVFDISGKFGLSVIESGDRGIGSMKAMKIQLRQLERKDPVAFKKLLGIANKGGTKTEDQLQVDGGKGWSGQDNDKIAKFISKDPDTEATSQTVANNKLLKKAKLEPNKNGKFTAGSVKKQLQTKGAFKPGFPKGSTITASGGFIRALQPNAKDIFQQEIMDKMPAMFTAAVSMLDPPFEVGEDIPFENLVEKGAEEAVKGTFFETFIRRALRSELSEADKKTGGLFDFPSLKGKEGAFVSLFGGGNEPNEFKNTSNEAQVASTYGKAIKHGRKIQQLAAGGSIFAPKGTDTVPAMLTPGEFVVNKKSAQSFGYGNLKNINKYAKGGKVQYLQDGGRTYDPESWMTRDEALAKYGGDMPKSARTASALKTYDKLDKESPRAAKVVDAASIEAYEQALDKGATVMAALTAAESVFVTSVEDGARILNEHSATVEESDDAFKKATAEAKGRVAARRKTKESKSKPAKPEKEFGREDLTDAQKVAADAREKARTKPSTVASTFLDPPSVPPPPVDPPKTKPSAGPDRLDKTRRRELAPKPASSEGFRTDLKGGHGQGFRVAKGIGMAGGEEVSKNFTALALAQKVYRKALKEGLSPQDAYARALRATAAAIKGTKEGQERLKKARITLANKLTKDAAAKGINLSRADALAQSKKQLGAVASDPLKQAEAVVAIEAGVPIPKKRKKRKKTQEELDKASAKSAQKMEHLTTGVSSAVGAIAGFSAALSGLDFSSPEAAMASLMSLTFAVSQAQASISAFAAMAKMGTVANSAAAASEAAETTANAASTASEYAEVTANTLSAKSEFMKGAKEGLGNIFGTGKKTGLGMGGGKGAGKGLMGGMQKMFRGFQLRSIKSARAGGAKGLASRGSGMLTKMAPKLGKVAAGAGVGAVASMLIGPIGNAISDAVLGKKEEIVPGVKGRRGVEGGVSGGAGVAGGLVQGAQGAAMGAAIGTAILPGFGTAIGALIGGVTGAVEGAISAGLAQTEFNAFVQMTKDVKGANEQLVRFSKLNKVTTESLRNLNKSVEKPIESFDKAQKASFAKEQGGIGFANVMGKGGMLQRAVGGSEVAGAGASALAGAGMGAMVGAALGALGGPLAPLTSTVGAAIGAVVGGVAGLVTALMTTDQTVKNTAISFDRAAQSITPEFIENLNKAFDQAAKALVDKLDMSQIKDLAAIQTVDQDLNVDTQTAMTVSAFKQMNQVLNATTGETHEFVKELQRLATIKMQTGLIKGVMDEAALLGDEGGNEFKAAFVGIRTEINKAIAGGNMDEVNRLIDKTYGKDSEAGDALKKTVISQMEAANATLNNAAAQEAIKRAAEKSRKALDALVAGLEQFGARTKGIAAQMDLNASQMKTSFAQITGEKTIGEFKQFNPFEHLASASNEQIDTSIGQMQAFGGSTPAGDVAFGGMGEMLKAGRDFPSAMKKAVDAIGAEEARTGEKMSTQQVIDLVGQQFGGELPPQMLNALEGALEQTTAGRQEGGKGAFTSGVLEKMFKEGGDVSKLLGKAFNATKQEMAEFQKTLGAMKNSLAEVARIQEQMAKHRLSSELAMLDKQEAIRDKIDNVLGTGTDAFGQAMDDLQKRVTIQLTGGLQPGEGVVPVGGDVLDPQVLFDRLKTLDAKRAKAQKDFGMGTPDEIRENNNLLGKLNREINGTEDALRTLANDTRKLAAIEGKIAEQQARGKAAGGTVDSILDGLDKFMRGEMSGADFNKQITGPLSTVEKAFSGEAMGFSEGMDLFRKIKSGDPLIAGRIRTKTEGIAKQRGISTDDAGGMKLIREEVIGNLSRNLGGAGSAIAEQLGMPELAGIIEEEMSRMFEAEDQAAILGNEMRTVGEQQIGIMQDMLARETTAMDTVLKSAHEGFDKAVTNFQTAINQFAKMREDDAKERADRLAAEEQKRTDDKAKKDKDAADQAVVDATDPTKSLGAIARAEDRPAADSGEATFTRSERDDQRQKARDLGISTTKEKKWYQQNAESKNPRDLAKEIELKELQNLAGSRGIDIKKEGLYEPGQYGLEEHRRKKTRAELRTEIQADDEEKAKAKPAAKPVEPTEDVTKTDQPVAVTVEPTGPTVVAAGESEVTPPIVEARPSETVPVKVVDEPAAATTIAQDEGAKIAAAGGCCSDILTRLDQIIGLLGVGGPPSAVDKAVTESADKAKVTADDPRNAVPRPPVPPSVQDPSTPSQAEVDQAAADAEQMDMPETAEILRDPAMTAAEKQQQFDESKGKNRRNLRGTNLAGRANRNRKLKEKPDVSISSGAGIGPDDPESQLSGFREAASFAPGRAAGGRIGGRGGRRRRGGGANMANRRKAQIDKREQRRLSRTRQAPGADTDNDWVRAFDQSIHRSDKKKVEQIQQTDRFGGSGMRRAAGKPIMSGAAQARYHKREVGLQSDKALKSSMGRQDSRIGVMKKTLGGIEDKDSPRAKRIQANIERAEAKKQDLYSRTSGGQRKAAEEAQKKKAEEQAAQETIAEQRRPTDFAGPGTEGAIPSAATPDKKQTPAGPGAAAGGNLEELLRGTAFAAKITEAFTAGGTSVAGQIKAAFTDVIPPKIEMTGELGVLKVHLTGGEILQKFNGTILKTIKEEVQKGIDNALRPEAKADGARPNASNFTGPGSE